MKAGLRLLGALVLVAILPAGAQDVDKLPDHPPVGTIRFECFWEAATPQDYVIIVREIGSARYVSRNPTRPEPPQDSGPNASPYLPDYLKEFSLSGANQAKIFKLAIQANYFNGQFDYKKHAMANTGTKTLTYADSARHYETTYNWSENNAIDQLTRLFEGISSTLEHGRKLEYLHRFDRLGLEAELKGMEDAAQGGYLAEIQTIRPVLENITKDSAVLNIARQRARRLLDLAARESGENAAVKTPQ